MTNHYKGLVYTNSQRNKNVFRTLFKGVDGLRRTYVRWDVVPGFGSCYGE